MLVIMLLYVFIMLVIYYCHMFLSLISRKNNKDNENYFLTTKF